MTKGPPPLYVFLGGGAAIGLLIGFIAFRLVGGPISEPQPSLAQATPTPTPAEMTNAQLRTATRAYVSRLRRFNSEFRETDQREEDADRAKFYAITEADKSEETKRKAWDSMTNKMLARRASFQRAFTDNFFADAQLLDQQLRKRCNPAALTLNAPPFERELLEHGGRLAGIDPIGDLATYLERLEKELPAQ